jgi:two-component system OmpR family sensor kinase
MKPAWPRVGGSRWGPRRWPLRRRLMVVMAALVVAGLALADYATYRTLHSYLLNREDQQLAQLSRGVGRTLLFGRPSSFTGANGSTQAFVEVRTENGAVAAEILARQGTQAPYPAPRLPDTLPSPPAATGGTPDDGLYMTVPATGPGVGPYRVRISQLTEGPVVFEGDVLVVATPLSDVTATLHKLVWTELGVSAAALALAVLIGSSMVRLGLRPLDDMADTADEIAGGRLDRRVAVVDDGTEVGRLGAALNAMLTRIEGAFAEKEASESRLRRFVTDASHELRTPLTSIRGYAELFRRGADRRPEDLAKVMSRIEAEATRMGVLVEDLLLLARLDQGRRPETVPVDLEWLVREAVDAARAVEPDRPLRTELVERPIVMGDRNRLRQVIDNLLVNVRVHTPADAPATVRVRTENGHAVVEVEDGGPGLPPDAGERVFERFYRADPSRSLDSGGVGLGLSIVQAITAAHGGTASAGPGHDGGACFRITLPLAPAEPQDEALLPDENVLDLGEPSHTKL